MKKIFLVIVVLSIISCNNDGIKEIEQSIVESDESSDETYYGNKISSDSISEYINVIQEVAEIGRTSAKLEGTIIETCAKKGCWMRVVSEADTLMVRFKDYGFFVPKEGVEGRSQRRSKS